MSTVKKFKEDYKVSEYNTYQKGEVVFARSHTGGGMYNKAKEGYVYISRQRTASHWSTQVPLAVLEEMEGFVDVEGRKVEAGDIIVRLNTTDNVNILERREVLAVHASGLLLAEKTQGGRPTGVSDSGKVMIVNR